MDIQAQIEREHEMRERGRRRETAIITKQMERDEAAETPAGIQLARRAVLPMANAIRSFMVKALEKGKAGRKHLAAKLLVGVDPELAAYITVRALIGAGSKHYSLKSTALWITEMLELELIADKFEAFNDPLYRSIVRNAQARGLNLSRVGKSVDLAAKKFELDRQKWTMTERLHLGTKLVEMFLESQEQAIIYTRLEHTGKGKYRKSNHRVYLGKDVGEWFTRYNTAATLTRPLYLPTVIPPKPWTETRGGAYYSAGLHRGGAIVRRYFKGQMEALDAADLGTVYGGVNALQETPWRINKRVLEVMAEAWESNIALPCLPTREDEPLPERPQEVEDDVVGGPIRKAWRTRIRGIHQRNAKNRSIRFEFSRALTLARENAHLEALYFPHRLDFRGRAYAAGTSLNPQGPDEVRGLLQFAEGQPLGKRGCFWLGVHGANLFGNDKVNLEDRYQWACGVKQRALEVANDPLSNRWWTEADKPWSFLAWCFEWYKAHPEAVSHLPIALDGSCNGIQHYSAMLRDPVGGAAVNLVPSDKPSDIYQAVADQVTEKLRANEAPEFDWIAGAWLELGVDRKLTKRPVMVLPYGGTWKSCWEYVREAVNEKLEGQENPFGADLEKAVLFLAKLVWASIGDVVVAAREGMGWLQKVARVATSAGVPLKWTTPSGFVAVMDYKEKKGNRIKTRFCGSLVVYASVEDSDKLDAGRQSLAVAPNFVHSLDASAMMLTLVTAKAHGINSFAMIHDSYGTHAADTDKLAELLRREFVEMYLENDVLAKFREEIAALLPPEKAAELPPVPQQGSLDLMDVLSSSYFFA